MRAQAGLEYLLTYGWALIAIATIIGILVMLTGSNVNTDTCTNFLHLICKGVVTDGSRVTLILQNATGQAITINPATGIAFGGVYGIAKIDFQGTEFGNEDIVIGPGEEFKITATTMAEEITITYYENQTGLTRTETSAIGTGNLEKTVITECGTTISNPGLYVLEGNMSTNTVDCINIESSNVTLDCQNNLIEGTIGNVGIDVGRGEITPLENIAVVNCKTSAFGTGIVIFATKNSTISNNTVYDSKVSGIKIDGDNIEDPNNNFVTNNTIYNNGYGLWIVKESNNNVISNNTLYENSQGISVEFSKENTIIENNSSNNSFAGIISVGGTSNIISNNQVEGNDSAGIRIGSAANSEINGNVLNNNGNAFYGISILASNEIVLNNNSITEQALGIEINNSVVELNNNTVCTYDDGIYCTNLSTVTGSGNIGETSPSCPIGIVSGSC